MVMASSAVLTTVLKELTVIMGVRLQSPGDLWGNWRVGVSLYCHFATVS